MSFVTTCIGILPYVCYAFLALALFGGLYRFLELAAISAKLRQSVRTLRSVDYRRFQDSEHVMPVSLIVPATTEQDGLLDCVGNLLSLEFKQYEVIVVADSGNRETWQGLLEEYRLLPFRQPYKKTLLADEASVYRSAKDVRLVVLDQKGAPRASALNAGANVSSYPIVAVVYPNQRLTKKALLMAVYAFVGDPGCVYLGSFPRVGTVSEGEERNKPSAFTEMQNIGRLRTLFSRRRGYETLGMYLPRQAAFGAFLKSAAMETDGFFEEVPAEQADLLLRVFERLRREKKPFQTRLLPDAVCYEQPKNTLRETCAAAAAEQRAMAGTLRLRGRPARNIAGVKFTRLAETGWPRVELAGALVVVLSAALGAVPLLLPLFYLLISALLGAAQSVGAVLLEENAFQQKTDTGLLLRKYALAFAENFGYRQCMALSRIFPGRERKR